MYTRLSKLGNAGFTLIEIIAAVSLLAMVVAALLPIFPQIMSWSSQTGDELISGNLLDKAAHDLKHWDESGVELELAGLEAICPEEQEFHSLKEYELNGKTFVLDAGICEEVVTAEGAEASMNPSGSLYRVNIRILSEGETTSESYTYIRGNEG
ncbi:type II secretion system protein [Virgibacillus xinjiangensis]|uniref:Type II secretion system protein n=1 Tax=Virgibacillus xinjiangensis TaxID=393090 RepID=A0ABV7CUY3_9BACI